MKQMSCEREKRLELVKLASVSMCKYFLSVLKVYFQVFQYLVEKSILELYFK